MRLPTLICVLGLVLLIACQPTEVEHKAPLPPLEVSLTADRTTSELELFTTLHCSASGSDGNYSYTWSEPSCSGAQCAILLKTFGNHSVSCGVSSNNSTKSAAVILQVTKRAKPIAGVYVFGDSLSYGYGLDDPMNESWPMLYTRTFRHAELHKYAATGASSYTVLDTELPRFRNDTMDHDGSNLVFVWIGANDIQYFIPPQDFERNYKRIIDELVLANVTDIVLMTIPDVSRLSVTSDVEQGINSLISQAGFNVSLNVKGISQDIIKQYNNIILVEAAERKLPVIDMFEFMGMIPDAILGSDRVHPNKQGHELIERKVQSDVESFYPKDELT